MRRGAVRSTRVSAMISGGDARCEVQKTGPLTWARWFEWEEVDSNCGGWFVFVFGETDCWGTEGAEEEG